MNLGAKTKIEKLRFIMFYSFCSILNSQLNFMSFRLCRVLTKDFLMVEQMSTSHPAIVTMS